MPDTHLLDETLDEVFTGFEAAENSMGPSEADTVARPFEAVLDTAVLVGVPEVEISGGGAFAEEIPLARWQEGLEPIARNDHPGHRTGLLAVIAMMIVLITYNFRHLRRLVGVYWEETVKIRRGRGNVFDERPASDTPVQILLILQCVVCFGILLAGGIHYHSSGSGIGADPTLIIHTTLAVALYIAAGYCGYEAVGYTFTSPEGRREWVRGFSASQALLGLALTVPAALCVFYPDTLRWTVAAGFFAWLFAKILFIVKGFRIFYDKISGLLYFILYLCTLEIIPLIWVYKISVY